MKSILKRSISVILAAIMIVTLLPISVLASAPTQTTEKATDVTATSATLWGYLSKNGGNYFSEYGFYWGTGKNPTKRQAVYKKTASESTAIINGTRFELELTGLKEGQTYYYCTYVKTTGGTIYKGAVGSFDTEAKSNPEVKTLSAEDIGQDKVTLCGKAVKNGGQYFSDYGFYWGTSSNPTKKITVGKKGSKTTAIDTPKEFTYQLSGLKAGTKYYYRAYVKTTSGKTIKGDVLSFTTGSGSAKVNSVKASSTSPYILSQTTFTIKTTPTANTGVIIYAGDYELGRVYDYSKSGSELSYKLKWTFASEGSKLITVYPLDQNGYYVKDGKATTTITVKSKGKCGSPDIQNEDGVEVEEGNSLHVSWKKPTNPKSGVVYNVYLDDVIVPGFDQTNATNIDLTSEQLSVGSHRLTIYGIAKQYSQSDPAFIRIYVTERNTVNPNPPEAAKTDDWNAGTTNEPQPGDFGYVPPQHIHDYQYIETGLGMHLAYCNNPGCDNPQFEAACVYDDNDVCKYCGGNRVEVQNNSIPDWFGDPFGGHGNPFTDDNQNNPVETVNNWSLTYSDDYEGSVGSEKDSEDNNAENVSGENNDSSTDTKIDSGNNVESSGDHATSRGGQRNIERVTNSTPDFILLIPGAEYVERNGDLVLQAIVTSNDSYSVKIRDINNMIDYDLNDKELYEFGIKVETYGDVKIDKEKSKITYNWGIGGGGVDGYIKLVVKNKQKDIIYLKCVNKIPVLSLKVGSVLYSKATVYGEVDDLSYVKRMYFYYNGFEELIYSRNIMEKFFSSNSGKVVLEGDREGYLNTTISLIAETDFGSISISADVKSLHGEGITLGGAYKEYVGEDSTYISYTKNGLWGKLSDTELKKVINKIDSRVSMSQFWGLSELVVKTAAELTDIVRSEKTGYEKAYESFQLTNNYISSLTSLNYWIINVGLKLDNNYSYQASKLYNDWQEEIGYMFEYIENEESYKISSEFYNTLIRGNELEYFYLISDQDKFNIYNLTSLSDKKTKESVLKHIFSDACQLCK